LGDPVNLLIQSESKENSRVARQSDGILLELRKTGMLLRVVRSVGVATVTCLVGAVATVLVLQAVERRWSVHAVLDLGAVVTVMGAAAATLICVPMFLVLHRSDLAETRLRAALLGAVCAGISGPVAFALVFADGDIPRSVTQWLWVLATPLSIPFVIAGAAFGAAWVAQTQGSHHRTA
jgi:hypothetical protein